MKHLPRTQEKVLVDHRDRVRQLERKAGKDARLASEEVALFTLAGAVALTTAGEEPRYPVQTGGQLVAVTMSLTTAGSSTTTVTVYLNGVSIGTVSLASAATDTIAYLGDYRMKNGDRLGVRVTTAGTGAKGLTVAARMKG